MGIRKIRRIKNGLLTRKPPRPSSVSLPCVLQEKVLCLSLIHILVEHISEVFGESATLDRFHGFIPGWEIPRMTTGMIAHGWALNTEYFAEVLHELRSDLSYASTVDSLISYKSNADKRDLTAIDVYKRQG